MTEREWQVQAARLRINLKIARQDVYHGQPEGTQERTYKALRDAEDALRLHLDNKSKLVP